MTDAQRAFDERRRLDKARQRERSTKRKRVAPEFIAKVLLEPGCRCCRSPRGRIKIDAHHIVHRNKMGRDNPLRDHPDNAMALCHECHMGSHDGSVKLRRDMLSASELAFIIKNVGEGYLDKHFVETDV